MKRSIWNLLFLAASFSLAFMGGVFVFREVFPEWALTQMEYNRRLAEVTGDRSKRWAMPKIQQIHLPEFKRTDRCITCHAGIENKQMADQPQPFRSHPDLGIPGFLEKHSFSEIGCTVCHHGQGPALEKKHAHGPVKHWHQPLLEKNLTVASCASCHGNVNQLQGAERLQKAWVLFKEKGCIGCHNLHGKGMLVGPELAETYQKSPDQFDFRYVEGGGHGHGNETVAHWIKDHFRDPQRVVPGYPKLGIPETPMPKYGLTDEEVDLLTALTISFALEEGSEEQPIPARFHVPAGPAEPEPAYGSKVEQGAAVFQRIGCVACHGPDGSGGIRNPNMDIGEEVPPLTHVGEGYSKEEIKEIIRDGRYPAKARKEDLAPPLWMPAWKDKLTEEEIDAVAEYLLSLSGTTQQQPTS